MSDFYSQLDIKGILSKLPQNCRFCCERRLVYEFAKILEQKGFQIFLEYPRLEYPDQEPNKKTNKRIYEDIRAEKSSDVFVFEFKYCPFNIEINHGVLKGKTRNRSPLEKRLKDFENDIERTFRIVEYEEIKAGFCIFITNQENIIKRLKGKYEEADWFCFEENKTKPLEACIVVCKKTNK